MTKELLVCDLDDVIAANAEGFTAWSNREFGTSLAAADYSEDFLSLWQVDINEVERRAAMFHESDAIMSYGHIDAAASSLAVLSEDFRIILATSRRKASELYTRRWIETDYPDMFEDIIFAGIYDNLTAQRRRRHLQTKAEIYAALQPDYVIDDQIKHCQAAVSLNIKAILFGSYSWNQADTLPPGITRCIDWPAVLKYFDER